MIFSPIPNKPRISQWFGERPDHYAQYGMKGHNGIDFSVPKGTQVFAPHEGYVHIQNNGTAGYGLHIIITSEPYKTVGTRRRSTLAHLSSALVAEGQFVSAGDVVALSGNSGDSSGPHLHWTYCLTDKLFNVLDYANGFHGAVDLAPLINGKRLSHVQLWIPGSILS